MAIISQKEAAKRFAKKWEGQGREKQDDSKFWLDLLQNVFRVSDPYSLIEFQKPVKMESSTFREFDGQLHPFRKDFSIIS